jgi:hypothetical protein
MQGVSSRLSFKNINVDNWGDDRVFDSMLKYKVDPNDPLKFIKRFINDYQHICRANNYMVSSRQLKMSKDQLIDAGLVNTDYDEHKDRSYSRQDMKKTAINYMSASVEEKNGRDLSAYMHDECPYKNTVEYMININGMVKLMETLDNPVIDTEKKILLFWILAMLDKNKWRLM